jgi:hypothetical protein
MGTTGAYLLSCQSYLSVAPNVARHSRREDIFGPDAHKFNPDRWLDAEYHGPGHKRKDIPSIGVYANLCVRIPSER